jgi:hypothetical protein
MLVNKFRFLEKLATSIFRVVKNYAKPWRWLQQDLKTLVQNAPYFRKQESPYANHFQAVYVTFKPTLLDKIYAFIFLIIWVRVMALLRRRNFVSFLCSATALLGPSGLIFEVFETTHRHTTRGTTPLDEWSARPQKPLPDNTQHSQQTDINALGRTPLDEWSARPQKPLPDNTQHSQETDINALGWIRTRNSSKRAAADPRLRTRGYWDRQKFLWLTQKEL